MTTRHRPPGIYELTNAEYHDSPALSASGVKKLVPPSTPAHYRHAMDNPTHSAAFDFGSAAHKIVLNDQSSHLDVVDAPDWKTKAARDQRDAAREAGRIPVLTHELATVEAMAEQVRAHPDAGRLFAPGTGQAEVSLFWDDPDTGVHLRARLDWLPDPVDGRLFIVPDYKTAFGASADAFGKSAANFGYHVQAAFYLEGIRALGIHPDPSFVFVAQEKDAPYLVNVFELDVPSLQIGRDLIQEAVARFAWCEKNDQWPGYPAEVQPLSLPIWYQRAHEDRTAT